MLFIKKQKKVQSQIDIYNEQVIICMDALRNSLQNYIKKADRDTLSENFQKVYKAEGRADDIRREIEVMMYTKSLFPESRGDILGLLETMDRVPNEAESTVRMILNQHINLPKEFHEKILSLVDISCKCVIEMIEAVNSLFGSFMNATVTVGQIDELESEADRLEADLIDQIFSSSLDGMDKILLRDFVQHLASITDRAENVGDRIRIIVAKRSI